MLESYDPELERITSYFHNIWESAILVAALELDLFSLLHGGPRGADDIAAEAGLDAKGVRILLDALCPAKLIDKRGDRYALTTTSARYLDRHGEGYVGPIHWGAARPERWEAWGRLAEAVRHGGPVVERSGEHDSYFRGLVQAISHSADYVAPLLAEHLQICSEEDKEDKESKGGGGGGDRRGWSILDAACGSGRYGLKLLECDPGARLTLADTESVLELAAGEAERSGVSSRVETVAGDLFEVRLPEGEFDLILLSHFLHSNSRQRCAEIVSRLARWQRPGGYLAVHEFVPDDQRRRSRFPLLFAANMYIANGVGDTYTFPEIEEWMAAVGYRDIHLLDTPGRSSLVIGTLE